MLASLRCSLCPPGETLLGSGTVPCPHIPSSHLPVQEPGVELEVLFPLQGLLGKAGPRLDPTWQQKGIWLPASRQGLPMLGGTSFLLLLPVSVRTDASCSSITTGQPTCTSRARCL